ncbi:acyl-CoA thioester hydrolase/BAAT C-terminal domain-containing protein [Cellulomonas alba]|uniref:Acyl-CoA thioester hydrolase/BAAT C-terminal domain-containing protein n=1 Tax=Cellulomonas alba TaxID=3053467 RepID=A0ABT7SF26_9CELL|nr:acyl-CoA thioester hydrolase/BAAT C-terminal domain-containing protein [Cellulomonas alba]MDM7854798.1 acyl-CoA thioester hydrolase/BAAT C-terminal domain-containing protein [Cellulomonas alba]
MERGTRSVVRDRDVCRRHGVVGVLVEPRSQARCAVVVLGGAEGGLHEADAVALAQEGFAALALAYFGSPGVPSSLVDIPLEYVFRALDLLSARGYASGSIGLLGGSRGGELALLVGSHDERVGSVVSVVGSGVVTAGIDYAAGRLDRILATSGAAWTVAGRRLPHLPYVVPPELVRSIERDEPVSLRDAFAALPTGDELEAISIPVERVRGGVLMVSAGDDGSWDCVGLSEVAAGRLRAADHPYPWAHVVLEGVGHTIAGPPGGPVAPYGPGPGVTFRYGGDPVLTADARAETWRRTVGFLRYTLPRETADEA